MMKMKKPVILLVLLLTGALLTGCQSDKSAESAAKESMATETAATETQAKETAATETSAVEQAAELKDPEAGNLPESSEKTTESLKAAVEAALGDAAELAPFTADELTDMTGILSEDVSDFVFLQGNGMDGREILVIRAKDEASADKVAAQLEKYLERRKKEHRDYAPDAYKLLTDAKVERKGLLLAVISGPNAEAELKALLAGE